MPGAPRSIPVSVIVVTRNEEARLAACLSHLRDFSEVWVVDSHSSDRTAEIARANGARVVNFFWNGRYPKKRQWALDTLDFAHERVLFVDADEIVTPALIAEIAALDWSCAGYFIRGRYVFGGRMLRHGLCNNKLCLFDRRQLCFPVIDDLGLDGMGEIEGHYQPVPRPEFPDAKIGQLREGMLHAAYDDKEAWEARHLRYARWEAGMNARRAWPRDPVPSREAIKRVFRALPFRGAIAFVHCYVLKAGFLDGLAGLAFAGTRARYYSMVGRARDLIAQ